MWSTGRSAILYSVILPEFAACEAIMKDSHDQPSYTHDLVPVLQTAPSVNTLP